MVLDRLSTLVVYRDVDFDIIFFLLRFAEHRLEPIAVGMKFGNFRDRAPPAASLLARYRFVIICTPGD